jgi:DNA-binding NarL/FixJ family response regulator
MKTRVLVVDDSPLIRAVLREAFERTHDIEVVGEAGDGLQAIERVRALRPDIVTMDVLMPVMDGLAATEEIMRVQPTPIVIVARDGGDSRALAVEALGKGALAVFPKPAAGFDDAAALRPGGRHSTPGWRGWPKSSLLPAGRLPLAKIRVLLVDDSSLIRQVMRNALAQFPDIEVVAEASDGRGRGEAGRRAPSRCGVPRHPHAHHGGARDGAAVVAPRFARHSSGHARAGSSPLLAGLASPRRAHRSLPQTHRGISTRSA